MRLRKRALVLVAGLTAASLMGVFAIAPAGAASKPAAPAKPTVAPGKSQVRVTWVAPANNGSPITGYVVTPFLGSKAQTARTFNTTATAQVIAGLTNSAAYTFRVAARNKVGLGTMSAPSGPATPTTAPTLKVATIGGKQIIVDSRGFTLYLFVPDGSSTLSKVPPGIVKQTWPPTVWSGTPTVGAGLTASKAAVHMQTNRAPEVSYNNHLLYTFVTDTKPGQITGEGVSNFFVVSPAGNKA